MGIFAVLMVVAFILYAQNNTGELLGFAMVVTFVGSYLVPLILNFGKLKVKDFFKGIVYVTYLSPTYVNIFTIYAISNIHDVSWGSRPSTETVTETSDEKSKKLKKAADDKEVAFMNFRSMFLIFWCVANLSTSYGLYTLFRESEYSFP